MVRWMRTVGRVQRLWALQTPQVIVGWINGGAATRMLAPCHEGTFLFRFSESNPDVLVLCVVKGGAHTPPLQILVHVLPTGFELMTGPASSIMFTSLADLVMRYLDLHFLYPSIPKGQVFGPGGVASQASTLPR